MNVDVPTAKSNVTHCLIVLKRIFPPPVVGALLGMLVALGPPIRGIWVDIVDRDDDAPVEFIYDGLYKIGAAAVPLNMIILGNSIAKGVNRKIISARMLRIASSIAVAKMVVMPLFGLGLTLLMQRMRFIGEPEAAAFFLVAMMVTATPTANNIMVMAELSGEDTGALSFCILFQYLLAPILLTVWLSIFIGVATS